MESMAVEVALRVTRRSLRDLLSCGSLGASRIKRPTRCTIRDCPGLGKKKGSLSVPLALHSNG